MIPIDELLYARLQAILQESRHHDARKCAKALYLVMCAEAVKEAQLQQQMEHWMNGGDYVNQ